MTKEESTLLNSNPFFLLLRTDVSTNLIMGLSCPFTAGLDKRSVKLLSL